MLRRGDSCLGIAHPRPTVGPIMGMERFWREACYVRTGNTGLAVGAAAGAGIAVAFDEMTETGGAVRPVYAGLENWLRDLQPEVLEHRRREAEFLFRRIGITFAVYGESESTERLIPFDVLPRILSSAEWTTLRAGLEQRVKAINLFLKDIYGRRESLRAGVVPEDLIFRNPVFRPGEFVLQP